LGNLATGVIRGVARAVLVAAGWGNVSGYR
jgi:hypothetical protein